MNEMRSAGPKGLGSDVKGELLRAGCALYEERGLGSVSLRDVADRAGVNQAMVRYYFKDKDGFESALLNDGFDQFIGALETGSDFKSVIRSGVSMLNTMPWLPILMTRTVYVSDLLRRQFIEIHAPKIVGALGKVLRPRRDLDPAYLLLTLISVLVFPQLARPVMGPVLGLTYDERFAAGMADHLSKLFQDEPGKE